MENSQLAPLTLIVEHEIVKLVLFLREVPDDWKIISIGRELSSFLISSNEADRSKAAREWLLDELRQNATQTVLCKDLDLLFHPSINLDPLVLFRQAGRHTKIVVLWPGSYSDGVLSYAVPEHSHYRHWKDLDGIDIKGVADALQ